MPAEHPPVATSLAPEATSEPLKLVLVDQSKDAYDAARDEADARLSEELSEGGRTQRFLKGIWKGNIAKEFYRQRYIHSALSQIETTQDVLVHQDNVSELSRSNAIDATITRFQSEHDEMIHADAGEKRELLDEQSEISTAFKGMIRSYAEGHLNDEALQEERTRFMEAYRETHGEDAFGRGLVTTDNMMQIARSVMGAVEHGESLDNVIANMQVITGEARTGVRTEANYNRVDKVIDKITKTKIGAIIGPEAVMTAVTVASIATKWGSHSVVGAALKTIAPGAGAGIWAGLRENKRTKDERTQHARERAMGKEFDPNAKRRQEMEATRYESVAAQYLTSSVREFGAPEKLATGNEAVQAALDALAQVQSRIDLSNKRGIDLISYSAAEAVGDERMALDLARAEVRVALEGHLTPEIRAELGYDDAPVHEIIKAQSAQYIELIDEDISAKDKAFKILKAKRVAKAAAIGVATGIIGGVVAQEVIASFDPVREGLIEQAWGAKSEVSGDGLQHQTLLHGMFESGHTVIHTDASHSFESYDTASESGAHGSLDLSSDHKLVENGDGTVNFVDPNGHASVENLKVNPDGTLPKESIGRLQDAGMKVEDHSFNKEISTTHHEQVTSEQYVQNHLNETTKVHRDLWYDNNTPQTYEQNELKLQWGGTNGLAEGGYQFSVAGMKPGGSWDGGESVDWNQAAANGNLFMSISASADSQTQTFMVPISPDGQVHISADSPAGHFFSNNEGHASFNGAYAEVVQSTGVDAEGTTHIRPLATLVGEGGHNTVDDVIKSSTTEHHANYTITTEGYDTTVNNFTEAAPGIPVESRRSLEAPVRRTPEGITEAGYYRNGAEVLDAAEVARRREETSPRLLANPEAELQPAEELKWYRKALQKAQGKAYVDSINDVIDASPELKELSPKTKLIVQVPVGAAGAAEADNIYTLLTDAYGGQDAASIEQTTLLLHVNWFDKYDGDDAKKLANIAKTRAEIARAKADRPDLTIAVIETEWKRDEVKSGVIGHVSRKMQDAALLSLDRAHEEGTLGPDDEVLVLRNDADPKGISSKYFANFIKNVDSDDEPDIFLGVTTFDNTKADRLPGMVYAANFMQSLSLIDSTRGRSVHTGGANFGVKSSMLAAIAAGGFGSEYNGVGSDDVEIGRRVSTVRNGLLATSRAEKRAYASHRYAAGGKNTSGRRIAKRISARIDTDSDRQEELYLQGVGMIHSWDAEAGFDFDANGYRDRNAGLNGEKGTAVESIRSNAEKVLERIRNDMEASIENFGATSATVKTALTFAFPGLGEKAYTLTEGADGVKFAFTEAGKTFIANHLTRDAKGRFDSYAARKQRQLYGKVKPGAKRRSDRRSLFAI